MSSVGARKPTFFVAPPIAALAFVLVASPAFAESSGVAEVPPAPAAAIEADAEARRLYDEARAHFRAGEYPEAIATLKQAFDRSGAPALLFDLGQVYRRTGACDEALEVYQRFLASGPSETDRRRAEARINDLKACLAEHAPRKKEAPAPAAPAATTAAPLPRAELALKPAPAPVTVAAPPAGRSGRVAGLAIAAGGVALGATGFVLREIATGKIRAIENDANGPTPKPYDERNGNWRAFEVTGISMLATGAAAFVGGAALYVKSSIHLDETGVTVAGLSPFGHLGLAVDGRF